MTINELVKASHDNAVAKGFYGENGKAERNIGELLMLITSELGECLEADRHNKYSRDNIPCIGNYSNPNDWPSLELWKLNFEKDIKDRVEDELSDAIIRIADMAGYLEIDLEEHIKAKMAYNATREKLHGKKY
jgi:NTP pyrophosphatase (non-canonical NTP hydrolase)